MKTNRWRHSVSFLVFTILAGLAIGSSEGPTNSSPTDQWWKGGTLHTATAEQWRIASYQNKLATSGDWLSSTVWNNHINSIQDMAVLKVKAGMLANAVDEVVKEKASDGVKVSEIAAAIITMSNDLGPK